MKGGDPILLSEDDLDNVVGGAINKKAIKALGLEARESKGHTIMRGEMSGSIGKFPNITTFHETGMIMERNLRSALSGEYDEVSISVKTTNGKMRKLTTKEIKSLLA